MLLAIVALKFTVSDRLPDIPYLTTLDLYLFGCMAFTSAIALEAAAMKLQENPDEVDRLCFW